MKLLFFSILVLFGAVSLALVALENPGYVLIAREPWSMEMSLTVFLILFVLGSGLFYLLLHGVVRLWNTPREVSRWRRGRRARRARESLLQGMIDLAEGRWLQAEKNVLLDIHSGDFPLANYLIAAYAAHLHANHAAVRDGGNIGNAGATSSATVRDGGSTGNAGAISSEKRDEYLSLAHQHAPQYAFAIGLAQGQLQLSAGQYQAALTTLTQLRIRDPKHGHVLALLAQVYRALCDWDTLAKLIPEMRKRKAAPTAQIDALELEARCQLLMLPLPAGSASILKRSWNAVPQHLRQHPSLLAIYVQHLIEQGEMEESENLLSATIEHNWSDALVRLYGQVPGRNPRAQMDTALEWLAQQGSNPSLLLTLGRLALRNNMPDKARDYLEKCISQNGPLEAYHELAQLLEQAGERDQAMVLCQRALALYAAKIHANTDAMATHDPIRRNQGLLRKF